MAVPSMGGSYWLDIKTDSTNGNGCLSAFSSGKLAGQASPFFSICTAVIRQPEQTIFKLLAGMPYSSKWEIMLFHWLLKCPKEK
jgi:hypothetical protein